jgi:formylglycine-generating enzyme required for sulfatase activity/predicted Ser/Thr protein kinase
MIEPQSPPSIGGTQPADPLLGQVVERYRIERILGQGGMGVVYAARHQELGSLAAVKTIHPQALLNEGARTRFVREAQALTRVQTEGLVRIYNIGQLENGSPYILMEYLQGQTLQKRLKQSPGGRMPVSAALDLAEQVATTLAAVHDHGVIHRDLKPENIMLIEDPLAPNGERVKLLDFGIAKLVQDNAAATLTQGPLGTPLYMAPESCEGKRVGAEADVYSLGCVLYEALCGRPPYLEDGSNVMLKHLFQVPLAPRRHVRDLPAAVNEFVLRLLSREPEDRPSAADVVREARELRLRPQGVRWRLRWLGRRLRPRGVGMWLAYLVGVPVLLFLLLVLVAADSISHWLPWPSAQRLLAWSSMVRIPGGRFDMGSSAEELQVVQGMIRHYDLTIPYAQGRYADKYQGKTDYLGREKNPRSVQVASFYMDRYEVTNQDFAEFLNLEHGAGRISVERGCPDEDSKGPKQWFCAYTSSGRNPYLHLYRPDDFSYGGINYEGGQFTVRPEFGRRPAVAMSWQAASDFCAAQRKRLPTEAEWEYVARRGGRRFPWGNELPRCKDAVLERCGPRKKEFCSCRVLPEERESLPAVGSAPKDRTIDGVFDMGGSVSEWTADQFVDELSQSSKDNKFRVVRGGAWTLDFLSARGAARFKSEQMALWDDIGFRCVRDIR